MLRRFKNPWALPVSLFFLGLCFSAFIAYKTHNWIAYAERTRFESAVSHNTMLIQKRLESNIQLIRSAGGLFVGSHEVTREDFKHFLLAQRLGENFPGVQAVGFGPLVPHSFKDTFEKEADIRGFSLFPKTNNTAIPVYFLEPFTQTNIKALGFDMASEPLRNTAMRRSLGRMAPTLSSKIELVQLENNPSGFLIYLPVFNPEQTHLGFVYAAMNALNLFDGIMSDRYVPIDFELYDGSAKEENALLFDSNPTLKQTKFSQTNTLSLYGHTWVLCFKADQVLDLGLSAYMPVGQLIFGFFLSLVISAWIYALIHTQQRAFAMADKMTKKVQEQLDIIDKHVIISSTDLDANITEVSQAFCDISGYTKEELLGKSHQIVRDFDTPESVYEELWNTILRGEVWQGELKNRRKDGSAYWVLAVISPKKDEDGNIAGFTSIRQDITDKKRSEELSITDPLTGLYNRLKLDELFHTFIHVSQRHGTPFSILLLDIDRFKSVNDTYGHQVGDTVLQEFADILRKNVRTEDVVGRWGGEEFMILAPGSDIEAAKRLAQKLRVEVETFSFSTIGHKTCSFGVSSYHKGDDEKSMVSRADDALYRAKANGRNRVEVETVQAASTALMPH